MEKLLGAISESAGWEQELIVSSIFQLVLADRFEMVGINFWHLDLWGLCINIYIDFNFLQLLTKS